MHHFRVLFAVALIALAGFLSSCGSDAVAVPDVVGYRLDDAHNKLKDVGFKKFDDVDVIQKRQPFMDSNWVVLAQSPVAGSEAKTSQSVRLEIGKVDDPGIVERLPKGSPVAVHLGLQADAEKVQQEQERKKDQLDATKFVEGVDARVRQARNVLIITVPGIRDRIAASGAVTLDDMADLSAFKRSMDLYWKIFEDAPRSVNPSADGVQEAIREFQRAADMLASADGPHAGESLREYDKIYAGAKKKYNENLVKLYSGSGVKAPTL